jgi:tetratricopeptide (TPR) repeat protein
MDEGEHSRRRWWSIEADRLLWGLERWPMLRHLIFEPRFRWSSLLVVSLAASMALAVLPIWITSPPNFEPVIRISLLSQMESSFYRSLALRSEENGRPDEAYDQWRAAIANNPADLANLRGSISNTLALPPRVPAHFKTALRNTFWLLQLARTNRTDLGFALRVYRHFQVDELVLSTLQRSGALSASELEMGCKALLRRGDARYSDLRAQLGIAPAGSDLWLHDQAYAAGWSTNPPARVAARAELEAVAALPDSERSTIALRLLLIVHREQKDPDRYQEILERIRDRHEDTPIDHATYWLLLRNAGRRDEALQAARVFSDPPVNSSEALRVAETFLLLGQIDDAIRFLERYAPEVGAIGDVWIALTDLLIQEKRWTDLRRVATEMRIQEGVRGMLGGYTYFLEGFALRQEGGEKEASVSFDLVPSGNIHDSRLSLKTASRLHEFGADKPALVLLRQIESVHLLDPSYWSLRVHVAHALGELPEMSLAAGQGYAANPNQPEAVNNLVATLILTREDPERLLSLATYLYGLRPEDRPVRVNFAFALIRNGRAIEGLAILDSVSDFTPGSEDATILHLGRAEGLAERGNWKGVLQDARLVEDRFLLPVQKERIRFLVTEAQARLETGSHIQN